MASPEASHSSTSSNEPNSRPSSPLQISPPTSPYVRTYVVSPPTSPVGEITPSSSDSDESRPRKRNKMDSTVCYFECIASVT